MIGNRFGALTVVNGPDKKRNGSYWLCVCDCGKNITVSTSNLKRKAKINGGCYNCYRSRRSCSHGHGSSKDPTYSKWQAMKARCFNSKNKSYANYGGRGITVCQRWLDFKLFLLDMGFCPGSDFTLERKDVNGHYEPANVIWLEKKFQSRNKTTNIKVNIDGINFDSLTEAAKHYGIKPHTVMGRLKRGYKINQALKKPVKPWNRGFTPVTNVTQE